MTMGHHEVALKPIPSSNSDSAISVISITTESVEWQVVGDWRHRLFGDGCPDWFALGDNPSSVCVKRGQDRRTYRTNLADRVIYAKVFEPSSFLARLKCDLLGAPAKREWRSHRQVESLGLPVPRSLAIVVRTDRTRRSVFITEAFGDGETLDHAWKQGCLKRQEHMKVDRRLGLIDAVAQLFALAHEHGLFLCDAHPRNILIRAGSSGSFEAAFVDLHPVHLARRAVALHQAARSLAQLDQFFHRVASRAQRMRFLRRYLAERPSTGICRVEHTWKKQLVNRIVAERQKHARSLARQRDRRLRRTGKYFARVRLHGGWSATVALQLERRHVFPEPDVPDMTGAQWRAALPALLSNQLTTENHNATQDHQPFAIVERAAIETPWNIFKRTILGSDLRRTFERSHSLRHRDQASELILGYAERRRLGFVVEAVLFRTHSVGKKTSEPSGDSRGRENGSD